MTISASRDLRRELCLFVLKLNFIKIPATKMPRAQCPLHRYHAWCESSTAAGKVFIEEAQKLTQGCVFNMRSHPLSASFWTVSVWVRIRWRESSLHAKHTQGARVLPLPCVSALLRATETPGKKPPRPAAASSSTACQGASPAPSLSAGSSPLPPVPSPPRCPWGHLQGEKLRGLRGPVTTQQAWAKQDFPRVLTLR